MKTAYLLHHKQQVLKRLESTYEEWKQIFFVFLLGYSLNPV